MSAAPPPKPCHHSDLCRCDVGEELRRAIEVAGDGIALSQDVGREADKFASGSYKIRVSPPAKKK